MADANIPLVARIMVQHGGAGSGPTGTNDARRQSKNMESVQKSSAETSKNSSMSLGKMIGIFAGVGLIFGFVYKMFKNSQVTKSVFGAIFKILGAMVDVFLAPFVPYIIPLLDEMISWLDPIAEFGEKVANKWMPIITDKIKTFAQIWEQEGWRAAMVYAWEAVAQPIFDLLVDAVVAGVKAALGLPVYATSDFIMGAIASPVLGKNVFEENVAKGSTKSIIEFIFGPGDEQGTIEANKQGNDINKATVTISQSGSLNNTSKSGTFKGY